MFQMFDLDRITNIANVDHPESIGVGPNGEAFTTGTGCQVYRLDLASNTAEQGVVLRGVFSEPSLPCGRTGKNQVQFYFLHSNLSDLKSDRLLARTFHTIRSEIPARRDVSEHFRRAAGDPGLPGLEPSEVGGQGKALIRSEIRSRSRRFVRCSG